jgi:hypothetical protein
MMLADWVLIAVIWFKLAPWQSFLLGLAADWWAAQPLGLSAAYYLLAGGISSRLDRRGRIFLIIVAQAVWFFLRGLVTIAPWGA